MFAATASSCFGLGDTRPNTLQGNYDFFFLISAEQNPRLRAHLQRRLRAFVDCGGDFRRTASGMPGQRRSTQEPAGLQRETQRQRAVRTSSSVYSTVKIYSPQHGEEVFFSSCCCFSTNFLHPQPKYLLPAVCLQAKQ